MEYNSFILSVLGDNPVLTLFLILGLGLVLGKVKIGFPIGSVLGILIVGIVAGHLGLKLPAGTGNIGFILFIYAIGVQAGPSFFGSLRKEGGQALLLAIVCTTSAMAVTYLLASWFDFAPGVAVGVMAGSLTSTPALVAAQDAIGQGISLPAGVQKTDVLNNLSTTYAITYVFGLAGLLIFLRLLPKIFRIDVVAEAASYSAQSDNSGRAQQIVMPVDVRAYRVEKESATNKTYAERDYGIPADIQRIKHDGEVFAPTDSSRLHIGDVVSVVAPPEYHKAIRERVGPEVIDYDVLDRSVATRRFTVGAKTVAGKTLRDMNFTTNYHCSLTGLNRLGLDIPRLPDLTLEVGDVLQLTGSQADLEAVGKVLGHDEQRVQETDLVTFAFGIALGVVLSLPKLVIGGVTISLGLAGGCLLAGLAVGSFSAYSPAKGRLPYAARYILLELGLLFFMMQIAVNAGQQFVAMLYEQGAVLIISGLIVMLIPVLISFVVGRFALKMNAAMLLGTITGAMTHSAALQQVSSQAKSSLPMIGYVRTYTFANIILTVIGAFMICL